MQHYGQKLKGLIDWTGIPISTVCRGAKVSSSTLYREYAKPYPDTAVCAKVLKYIKLPMDALFSERDLSPLEVDILEAVRKLPEDKQRALLELIRGK